MNSFLTIDASLAFKIVVPNPDQGHLEQLVTHWVEEGVQLTAPTLWLYEMTSVFAKMAHFGHLSHARCQEGLKLALGLGIQLIAPTEEIASRAFAWTLILNRASAYDSFYLALAESQKCDLWTADRRLKNAVDESWVRFAGK